MIAMMRKINISTKLVGGSLIFSAIVAVAFMYILITINSTSAISIEQRSQVESQVNVIQKQGGLLAQQQVERQKLALVNSIDKEFSTMRAWLLDLSVSWLNEAEDSAEQSNEHLSSMLGQLEQTEPELAQSIRTKSETFNEVMLEAVDAYVDENRVKGNSLVAKGRVLAEEIDKAIAEFQLKGEAVFADVSAQATAAGKAVTQSGNQVSQAANQVVDKNSELLAVVVIMLILFLLLSGLYSYAMRREVCTPIDRLRETLENIEQTSDLTMRFESRSHDEIGAAGLAFNRMMERFSGIVENVSKACQQLDGSMNHLIELMQEAKNGATAQQSATDQVATAINEMAATVQEVATHTQHANMSTQDAKSASEDGRKVVDSSVQGTLGLSDLIKNANEVISRVENDSNEVGTVIEVIRGISEQTNLLALNAAIEAARAGESGRGFAVVADEVRTLAQRTQESTEEIDKMISNLQAGSREAVSLMSQGTQDAQNATQQAEAAGGALQIIEDKVNEINELNTQIATSAEEQSSVADEINRNVVNISDSCSTTTQAVEQTVGASEGVMKISQHLAKLMSQFKV